MGRRTLQWGHALSGMDIISLEDVRLLPPTASMGPCPFRHGYSKRDTDHRFLRRASMGPCPFRHGYARPGGLRPNRMTCFNGAMPFQAWIYVATPTNLSTNVCFNGAMPFQAWIYSSTCWSVLLSILASMGPCPFRHGYVPCGQVYAIGQSASMGPCPFRHGYEHLQPHPQ